MNLTYSQLINTLIYDPETGFFTKINESNKQVGKKTYKGYVHIVLFGKTYQAHRLAWFYVHGEYPKKYIDHINGVKDDNRISNLRESTHAENLQNQKRPQKSNTSGYMGVTFHKFSGKWMAQINHNNKNLYIGLFDSPIKAHEAYLAKKREIHEYCTI